MHRQHKSSLALLTILLFALGLHGCSNRQQSPPPANQSLAPSTRGGVDRSGSRPAVGSPPGTGSPTDAASNLALGNPSQATNNQRDVDNYLLQRPQYALSFNHSNGGPNWVSWHVQRSDLGRVPRGNNFAPDPDLPPVWQIRPNDYSGSGYDRGHQCPSGDRTASPQDNTVTFYMSNMLPQQGDLNRHVWEKLEAYCRSLVQRGNELYIVAGGHGSKERIGRGKVNVPTDCWKIVVVLPEGDNDVSRIDSNTRVIAVDMPNAAGIANDKWQKYITSVTALEQATGYHFLTNLSPALQDGLKARQDSGRQEAGTGESDTGRSRSHSGSRRRRRNGY